MAKPKYKKRQKVWYFRSSGWVICYVRESLNNEDNFAYRLDCPGCSPRQVEATLAEMHPYDARRDSLYVTYKDADSCKVYGTVLHATGPKADRYYVRPKGTRDRIIVLAKDIDFGW